MTTGNGWWRVVGAGLAAAMVCAATPTTRFGIPDLRNVPVERLARNLEALIAKDPSNITLRINLARSHAMAYALKTAELTVPAKWEQGAGPHFEFGNSAAVPFENKTTRSEERTKAGQAQLAIAIAKYRDALSIAPDNLVANLGFAWCLEQAGEREKAIAAYRRTIALSWAAEQRAAKLYVNAKSITEEASTYLFPLLDRVNDAEEIALVRERIKIINTNAQRWITPIAIPLEAELSADDLRDERASVLFDADGSGIPKRWTWITPRAGWLVSDIRREGRITSALQLFGNVTWWLFWHNGYEPLRALDDNGDGRIAGRELDGLAIWRDADTNGISEPGEVRALGDWKIVSLSWTFQYDSADQDEIAYSPQGVTFSDGSTRPTFDLILRRPGL